MMMKRTLNWQANSIAGQRKFEIGLGNQYRFWYNTRSQGTKEKQDEDDRNKTVERRRQGDTDSGTPPGRALCHQMVGLAGGIGHGCDRPRMLAKHPPEQPQKHRRLEQCRRNQRPATCFAEATNSTSSWSRCKLTGNTNTSPSCTGRVDFRLPVA